MTAIKGTAEDQSQTTAPQDLGREEAPPFGLLRQVREDILCCVLRPDQRLRFRELRQRYDASVGTLREALSYLVSEGLARTEPGRGFQVAPISWADFLDLSELRIYFETVTLADAIRHGTDAWEAEIASSYCLLAKLVPPKSDAHVDVKREWGKRYKRFHDSLVATCRSPWLLHFRAELFDQARRYYWLTTINSRSLHPSEHLKLRDAVLARDIDYACSLLEQHIRTIVRQIVADAPSRIPARARSLKRRNHR